MPSDKDSSIILVGAGVFGLSLAHELSRRGYKNITILDRFLPPVPDGSSVDISRVVRPDYTDPLYLDMALRAQSEWKQAYPDLYHESGILFVSESGGHPYTTASRELLETRGFQLQVHEDAESIAKTYPEFRKKFGGLAGYCNPRGAWVDADRAVRRLAIICSKAGVSFITGHRGTVVALIQDEGRVAGVRTTDGAELRADQVILASGGWTARLIDMSSNSVSTCQPIGFIQLTDDEYERFKHMPITQNHQTGFFVFPPTPDTRLLKFARHGHGWETRVAVENGLAAGKEVSAPSLIGKSDASLYLPREAEESFRENLRRFFPPSISEREFCKRRLCWYTDSTRGDFIVDHHPQLDNLFLATGGSGQ